MDKLPQDLRDLITEMSRYVCYEVAWRHGTLASWCLDHASDSGIEVVRWSKADIAKATKLSVEQVLPKMAAKTPECAQIVDLILKQLKDHGRL